MDIEYLDEVIEDLLDRGYSPNFDLLHQAKCDLNEDIQALPAHEFVIDEIHCCRDGSLDIIYVFAISSSRYSLKAVVINAIVEEATITTGEVIYKIKSAFLNLFKGLNR